MIPECNNHTCDDFDAEHPYNCRNGNACLEAAEKARRRGGPKEIFPEDVAQLQQRVDKAENDLKCLRDNCFTFSEVTTAVNEAMLALWRNKKGDEENGG